jgi:hypothetical protein
VSAQEGFSPGHFRCSPGGPPLVLIRRGFGRCRHGCLLPRVLLALLSSRSCVDGSTPRIKVAQGASRWAEVVSAVFVVVVVTCFAIAVTAVIVSSRCAPHVPKGIVVMAARSFFSII